MKMRRFGYQAVVVIVMSLVFAGFLEIGTRLYSAATGRGWQLQLHERDPGDRAIRDIYQWHPFTGFTFKPDANLIAGHPNQREQANIYTDQYGFLSDGQELILEKPESEIRIAAIGGSTTACINLPFEKTWPGYLGQLLKNAISGKTIRIINAGVPGFDTSQSIGNLALRVLPFKPDVVIIYHAYNDLKAVRPELSFRADYSHIHTAPYGHQPQPGMFIRWMGKSMFFVRLRNQLREYRMKKAAFEQARKERQGGQRLDRPPPAAAAAFKQHMESLVAIATASGSKVILASFATLHDPLLDTLRPEAMARLTPFQQENLAPMLHFIPGLTLGGILWGIREYNEQLKQIADAADITLVDAAAAIPHDDRWFVDRVHFSDDGAKKMAEAMLPVVLAQIGH
ncbi:MAG: SGNH/GDSL hydrolase family protein [Pseudomonadota bacterium]